MKKQYVLTESELGEILGITKEVQGRITDAKKGNITDRQALEGINMDIILLQNKLSTL